MDFDLSDEQRMLRDSVQRLLASQCTFEQRRLHAGMTHGHDPALWARFADMGLLGLPFAEADGGLGGSAVDILIVMGELGRRLCLEPYLSTVVLAGGLLRAAGSAAQRAAHVPGIVSGEATWAFAFAEAQSRYDLADVATRAHVEGDGWVLEGHKRCAIGGDEARHVIVSARTQGAARDRDGVSLFIIDAQAPGVTRRGYVTQDRARAADIRLEAVRVGRDALLGEPGAALPVIERTVDEAIAALCAEAVGVMERLHEITVDYLKVRRQFGVAVGSFQALQHRAVDMLVAIEQARSMALYATMMSTDPDPAERSRAMSAAKVQIGRSARLIGQEAIQLHGGIGMTEECQAGHYFRRLTMIELLFGDTGHHLGQLANAGGMVPA